MTAQQLQTSTKPPPVAAVAQTRKAKSPSHTVIRTAEAILATAATTQATHQAQNGNQHEDGTIKYPDKNEDELYDSQLRFKE